MRGVAAVLGVPHRDILTFNCFDDMLHGRSFRRHWSRSRCCETVSPAPALRYLAHALATVACCTGAICMMKSPTVFSTPTAPSLGVEAARRGHRVPPFARPALPRGGLARLGRSGHQPQRGKPLTGLPYVDSLPRNRQRHSSATAVSLHQPVRVVVGTGRNADSASAPDDRQQPAGRKRPRAASAVIRVLHRIASKFDIRGNEETATTNHFVHEAMTPLQTGWAGTELGLPSRPPGELVRG